MSLSSSRCCFVSARRTSSIARDSCSRMWYLLDAHRFVIAIYVMTRDLGHVYDTGAPTSDPRRLDLAADTFRVRIGAVDGVGAQVDASDPLNGSTVRAKVVSRTRDGLVVDLLATDSPRVLTIDERTRP